MRIKILMIGDEPASLLADNQLLKDKNILVYTCFNTDNIDALIEEIMPDIIFINPQNATYAVTHTYNLLINNIYFTDIPIIYTLTEDDVYLVNRRRVVAKSKRNVIADNIVDAVKMAMYTEKQYTPKMYKINTNLYTQSMGARA